MPVGGVGASGAKTLGFEPTRFGEREPDMVQDWQAMIADMNKAVGDLRQTSPDVMKAFSAMAQAAHSGSALDDATKELIALSISVAVRCAPCIAYHTDGALKHGASREAIAETLAMAIYMGAGPSVMYAAEALEAANQLRTSRVPHA